MSKNENLNGVLEKLVVHDRCDENALISVFVRIICDDKIFYIFCGKDLEIIYCYIV